VTQITELIFTVSGVSSQISVFSELIMLHPSMIAASYELW